MCGSTPSPPDTAKIAADAAAERIAAETDAAQRNNSRLAARNRSRLISSLSSRDAPAAALAAAPRPILAPKPAPTPPPVGAPPAYNPGDLSGGGV